MQYDPQKLKEAVLYIAAKCSPETLGAVKLHKILYFSDMIKFATEGTPLTGATYRKRPNGPMCQQLNGLLDELRNDNSLEVKSVDYFGYMKKEFIAKRDFDSSRFTSFEIALLDDLISFVCTEHSAKSISEFSHQAPWSLVDFGEEIDYLSSFLLFPDEASDESMKWAESMGPEIETERSKKDTLGYKDGRDFRSRVLEACEPVRLLHECLP